MHRISLNGISVNRSAYSTSIELKIIGSLGQSMEMDIKFGFSAAAIALTIVAFIPYIASILSGSTKPHVFSWIIWGTTTMVVFFAQMHAKGGVGAWPTGVSAVLTTFIALLAFWKRADISITKLDQQFFWAAMASLPLWYVTSDPMWAVIVLTAVDLFGFAPTVRRAYHYPHQENMSFFGLFMLRNLLILLALESYSVATSLFPFSVGLTCFLLLIMIHFRRKVV